jgi:transposase, IS30 family
VKKGPGRRPQSAKRQRFTELRARGWSILAAAREVGVSRTAGNNWSHGYKTYRNGQVTGFVPALDRLAVRQISGRYLSQDERIEIADLRHAGLGIRQIAGQRAGHHRQSPASCAATPRRLATGRSRRTARRPRIVLAITGDASKPARSCGNWSPSCWPSGEARSRSAASCGCDSPASPAMRLCHESIYQAIYQPGSPLRRPSPLAPHHRSPLRTGRDHRRAHQHAQRRRPRFEQPMLTIRQRPFDPLDRSQAGHWEGDLIIGTGRSAIGTLVERQTRTVRLLHMPCRDSDTLHGALLSRMADLPPALLRSITWDQGTEMARHLTITRSLGAPVYFCDSHSPWQRGSNENMNGLLRDYFPKGTDLSAHPPQHLLAVENELNNRPRRILGDRAPAELLAALLTSESPPVLRR